MFKNKKILLEIEKTKNEIEKEKQELLAIKQYLEDNTPKIDISNIYVWLYDGIYNIVEMNVKNITGTNIFGRVDSGYVI